MVIDIQFDEASDLLWELYREIPEGRRDVFSERANRVSCCLRHPPSSDTDVLVPIKLAVTLSDVVLPLERPQVA